MEKHTKGKWEVTQTKYADNHKGTIEVIPPGYSQAGRYICRMYPGDTANAVRIVACVNACEGIPTEALEAGVVKEMVEALKEVTQSYQDLREDLYNNGLTHNGIKPDEWPTIKNARTVLAKIGGNNV